MAALLREAVDRLLQAGPSADRRREAALDVVGAFSSGESDVSERHDEYLSDAFGS